MEKTRRNKKQAILVGFIKKYRMDLNIKCNKTNGENVEIPKENDQVKREVQGWFKGVAIMKS